MRSSSSWGGFWGRWTGALGLLGLLAVSGCGGDPDDTGGTGSGDGSGAESSDGGGSSNGGNGGGSDSKKVDPYGEPSDLDPSFKHAFNSEPVGLNCADSYEKWRDSSAARIEFGETELYVAFQQTGGNNQDPMFRRFDNGKEKYCEHHEKNSTDGRAYGLAWDGGDTAYVVYSVTGGGTEFDSLAKGHWVTRYGDGGASAKVSVIASVEVQFGTVVDATFVVSRLSSGKTNSLIPAGPPYVLENGDIEFHGHAAFGPLNPDGSAMCTPQVEYPNGYRVRLSPDLTSARCADTMDQEEGGTCSMITSPCD